MKRLIFVFAFLALGLLISCVETTTPLAVLKGRCTAVYIQRQGYDLDKDLYEKVKENYDIIIFRSGDLILIKLDKEEKIK